MRLRRAGAGERTDRSALVGEPPLFGIATHEEPLRTRKVDRRLRSQRRASHYPRMEQAVHVISGTICPKTVADSDPEIRLRLTGRQSTRHGCGTTGPAAGDEAQATTTAAVRVRRSSC